MTKVPGVTLLLHRGEVDPTPFPSEKEAARVLPDLFVTATLPSLPDKPIVSVSYYVDHLHRLTHVAGQW